MTPVESQRWQSTALIWLFILGWATQEFTLFDVGKYSVPLIYLVALPFCLKTTWRSLGYLILPLVSCVFAAAVALLQGGVAPMAVASQGALQLLAIFFGAGIATFDWRRQIDTLNRAVIGVGVPLVVFGGYQMFARTYRWRYAFLPVTNQQAYAMGGRQRGWEKDPFTRASSLFVEPSEFGYYCLWLMLLGLSTKNEKTRVVALSLSFLGIMFSQSLSAVLGAAVLLIGYIAVSSISFNVVRQAVIVLLASVMAIFSVKPLIPEAFDKFYARVEQALTLDNRADSGRVDHLPENWEMFKAAPVWGGGLASISSADSNGVDVTTFTYFLMLIERGIVGTIFFMTPWLWLGWRALKLPKDDPFRTTCLLLSILNLYSFGYSSMAYSLPFWLALGICASCILHTYRPAMHLGLSGMTNWPRMGAPEREESRVD